MSDADPGQVLQFWFAERVRPLWFDSTPEFDAEVRARFLATWEAAARGELDHWAQTPDGAVALAIVLDQFPLNMFRGRPEAFATEAQALAVTRTAIARGDDAQLPDAYKTFLYMPLMHSEDLADQDQSVELYTRADLRDSLTWAIHHRELIRRFGRFPHRNEALGRQSSPEERAYLDSPEAFLG